MRFDGRNNEQMRPVSMEVGFINHAEGSVLIKMGNTWVICTATVEEKVPSFLKGAGKGWVTAEYGMLPRSTNSRMAREAARGKQSGRTQEIQRLIGRALRPVVDLSKLGERTIHIDCDVIKADGGTRTASVTGSYIALAQAIDGLMRTGALKVTPLVDTVAAISLGIVDGEKMLDLCYEEDSKAEVDMNIVMTGSGKLIEIQGTAENEPFSLTQCMDLIYMAKEGIMQLIDMQKESLAKG